MSAAVPSTVSDLDILDLLAEAVGVVGPDGAFLHTNAAAKAILDEVGMGHSARPAVDRSWDVLDAAGDLLTEERMPTEITRLRGEECTDAEIGFRNEAGTFRWLRISTRRMSGDGPPFGVVVSFVDISAARQMRVELDRERERYRTVVESLQEGVVIQDTEDHIVAANARAGVVLGLTHDQLLGRASFDPRWRSVHPDGTHWRGDDHPGARVVATGQPQLDVLMGIETPDGAQRWVRVNATPLRDATGEMTGVVNTFVDETEVLRDREELADTTQVLATAFNDAPVGMALVGLDGAWLKVNHQLCALTGYTEQELLATTFQAITHPDDLDADLGQVERLVAGDIERYSMEKRYFTAGGDLIWVNLSVSLVASPDGTPKHFISQIEDISERKRLETVLRRLADNDPLTELWNRRRFEEELQRQVGRCKRYGERAALFLLDLDDFKQVNDTLGHKAGDDVLRGVSATMRGRLRSTDFLARLGGDEFAVVLPNVSQSQAGVLAEELARSIRANPVRVRDRDITATASIGVAFLDADVKSDEAALMAADIAMYRAKAAGGDRTSVQQRAVLPGIQAPARRPRG